jgi:hypothetical protein
VSRSPVPASTVPWDQLSDSAQQAVVQLIALLADGYTGDITVNAKDGGVTVVRWPHEWRPRPKDH